MPTFSSPLEQPRKLYEWRGGQATRPTPTIPEITLDPQAPPVCSSCAGSVEKVVGGWWCSACELASY
jgi:hypothetical protein